MRYPKGGSILTWQQKEWAYDKWCEGYKKEDIAAALFVSPKTITKAMRGRVKVKKPLVYPFFGEEGGE